jgi:hypothetical protein
MKKIKKIIAISTIGLFILALPSFTIYENAKSDIVIALDPDAKEQVYKMYQKLNAGKLRNRVFVLQYPDDRDLGDLFKDKEEFNRTVQNYRQLSDIEIF